MAYWAGVRVRRSFKRPGCDARPELIKRVLGPLCVGAALVANGLQLDRALLEHRIGDVGDSVFDGVLQPLELSLCFGRTLRNSAMNYRSV
jgi:hypothetical protein